MTSSLSINGNGFKSGIQKSGTPECNVKHFNQRFWCELNRGSFRNPNWQVLAHVADGLPLPLRIATKIRVHFFDSLHTYEYEISIKEKFHRPVSELPAKPFSQFGPSRLDWLYCLTDNSMKFFLCSFYIHMGVDFQKVHFRFCCNSQG